MNLDLWVLPDTIRRASSRLPAPSRLREPYLESVGELALPTPKDPGHRQLGEDSRVEAGLNELHVQEPAESRL